MKEILNKRDEIHQSNIDLTVINGEIKSLVSEGEKLKNKLKLQKKS
jgi:chromosome segregation protein